MPPTMSEPLTGFATRQTWVKCSDCGWIDIDAVFINRADVEVVTAPHDRVVVARFYCPCCEKNSESPLAFGDKPDAPAAQQEVTT